MKPIMLTPRELWLAGSLIFLIVCSIYGVLTLGHCLDEARSEARGWQYLYTNHLHTNVSYEIYFKPYHGRAYRHPAVPSAGPTNR